MGTLPADHEQELGKGLSIIHSNHLEDLRRVAVQWIGAHPLKPLEDEVFVVQSNGMAQWLKLALARNDGCGISAALDIQLPARFLWSAYRAVLGEENIPRESPYDKDRLVWRLLRLLPALLTKEGFEPLARFLAGDRDLRKRYQLAHHLADLFDQYQVYRADWLEDWASGLDVLRNAKGDTPELPEEQKWQAELWRRIRADVPEESRGTGRSELHNHFLRAANALGTRPDSLPRRVIVFGISSLPRQALEALDAVARHSQVLLFIHNPCRHYWADIIEDRELLRIERARHGRKPGMAEDLDPDLLHQSVNPLLAAWGKQGRDYIGLMYAYDRPDEYEKNFAEIDMFSDYVGETEKGSLLARVQQGILDLTPLPGPEEEKQVVAEDDHSITFQLAHSRQREVEILQDRLLRYFETVGDLKPRDVIVMTPDIDAYSPHIEAVFGNLAPHDPRYVPFTIADRPERSAVPMLKALDSLMHLPESRMTAGDLMDLMEVPAFRGRFGLGEADLPVINRWIQGAGIRWGLSAKQRTDFGLPDGLEQNTWLFGLRRMLLGYAVGSGEHWEGIEPYDEIGGLDAALVGPLSIMLDRLEKHRLAMGRPVTPGEWCRRIRAMIRDCFVAADSRDRLIASRMEEVLEGWLTACDDAGLEEELTLAVVRENFLSAMNDSSMSQRFLAGKVNFCTLMPMRAIPFKVVCLLGMNDGEYPRSRPPLDFDLMSGKGRYRPGDRSRREDDRYLFLEALLSAREKLYISYIGRSIRDNSERMPSVLVGQLRDHLASGWRGAPAVDSGAAGIDGEEADSSEKSGDTLLDRVTCLHPLQPFSRKYFPREDREDLYTYAHEWREVLEKEERGKEDDPLDAPLYEGSLSLTHLIRFMKNPVQSFFNQRLKVFFDDIDVTTLDQEPFALDNLAPFGLGRRLLDAGLEAGASDSREAVGLAVERLRRTGELPLGAFGEISGSELAEPALSMLEHHHELSGLWPDEADAVEIRFPLAPVPGDRELEDWLGGLRENAKGAKDSAAGRAYGRWEFYPKGIMAKGRVSRVDSLVGLWVKHLAGCSAGLHLTSYLVAPDGVGILPPMPEGEARKHLTHIVKCWWDGLMGPLPVTAKTGLAWQAALVGADSEEPYEIVEQKAREAARKAYEGDGYNFQGEKGYSVYLERAYGDFEALWHGDDNRFRELSEVLYAPLAAALGEVG